MSTQNPVSVITSASKGIGLATAHRLKAMGHQVIGLARRQPEQSFSGKFIEIDLANAEATAKVAETIASQYAVNHLINNVGVSRSETRVSVNKAPFGRKQGSYRSPCETLL
jgi:3-oxoacyl-[acyl-carrier protein] reductase